MAKQIENNSIKQDLFQRITNENQRQLADYMGKKRVQDSMIMEKAKKYEEESMVADMLASKVKTTDQANNDFPKFSIPIGIDMNKDKEDVGSDHAVQDGGYMNVESTSFDNGDSKGMSNILGQL